MEKEIRILTLDLVDTERRGSVKAILDVAIDDIVIRDFKILDDGKRPQRLAMPSKKRWTSEGIPEFRALVVLPGQLWKKVEDAAVELYQKKKGKQELEEKTS